MVMPAAGQQGPATPKPGENLFEVVGRVVDATTNVPLNEVKVTFGRSTATTDADGEFAVVGVPEGVYSIRLTLEG